MHQLLENPDRPYAGSARLAPPLGLACEAQLRVAAATLSRASTDEITAATVVGIIGADDLTSFERLIGELADEFGLEAAVEIAVGSFSVRFKRCAAPAPDPQTPQGIASWLKHHLSRAPSTPREPAVEPTVPAR
jgi:hypothetical protein